MSISALSSRLINDLSQQQRQNPFQQMKQFRSTRQRPSIRRFVHRAIGLMPYSTVLLDQVICSERNPPLQTCSKLLKVRACGYNHAAHSVPHEFRRRPHY